MKITDSAQKQLLDEIHTTLAEVQKTLLTHDSVLSEFVEYSDKRTSKSLILNRLKDQIRIELLADLLKQQESAQEDTKALRQVVSNLQTKHELLESELAQQIHTLNTQLQAQNTNLISFKQDSDITVCKLNLIDQALNFKASTTELEGLRSDMGELASIQSLHQVWTKLEDFAEGSTVQSLQQALTTMETDLAQVPSAKELQEVIKEVESRNMAQLKQYTRFSDVDEAITRKEMDMELRLDTLSKKVHQDTDMLSKRMTELKKHIDKEPWQPAVAGIKESLRTKAEQLDLDILAESTFPKLKEVDACLEAFKSRIDQFDAALARFDEIILSKASKDDVGVLSTRVAQCVEQTLYDTNHMQTEAAIRTLQQQSAELTADVERVCQQLNSHGISYTAQAKKNRELAWAVANIQELQQLLTTKADLSQLHTLRSTLGTQQDIEKLKHNHSTLDKVCQQTLVIIAETLRSTLQSGESPRRKPLTREALFDNAASLANKSPLHQVAVRDTRPCSVKAGRPALLRSRLKIKSNLHDQFGDVFKTPL